MKLSKFLFLSVLLAVSFSLSAQVEENAGGVRRRTEKEDKNKSASPGVSDRMQGFFQKKGTHDADLSYMKEVYRKIDLEKGQNAALY